TSQAELLAYLADVPDLAALRQWAARREYASLAPALRQSLTRLLKPTRRNGQRKAWPRLVLVFDTETTIDPTQRLLFGCWRLCSWSQDERQLKCIQEGLVYADELPA